MQIKTYNEQIPMITPAKIVCDPIFLYVTVVTFSKIAMHLQYFTVYLQEEHIILTGYSCSLAVS